MKIKNMVKATETIVIDGHMYNHRAVDGKYGDIGDIIITDRRIFLQYGDNITIIPLSKVTEIFYSDYYVKNNNFWEIGIIENSGRDISTLFFPNNAEWRAWSEKVFEALSKYVT